MPRKLVGFRDEFKPGSDQISTLSCQSVTKLGMTTSKPTTSCDPPSRCNAVLVLAESTAYGWLDSQTPQGAAFVERCAVAAAVSCGGSLLQPGSGKRCAIDMAMEWLLGGGQFFKALKLG